jgi:hypothetical protein
MRRLVIGSAAVMATLVLGAMASVAAAVTLPSVLFLAGKTSAVAKATSSSATTLETVVGSKLTGKGLEATLTISTAGSALGPYVSLFKEVSEGTNKCKTGTLSAGNVEIDGEFHIVTIREIPLEQIILLLVSPKTIVCGTTEKPEKVKIKVEGSAAASFNGTLNSEIKEFKVGLKGAKGKPAKTAYLNDAGETLNASLKSNFGLGVEESDENIAEEVTFTSEGLTIDN